MNMKLILKTLFLIFVLLFLVLLGMDNQHNIKFAMPRILTKKNIELPAAIMYYTFFAIGLLTGTILTAGKKGGAKTNKVEK